MDANIREATDADIKPLNRLMSDSSAYSGTYSTMRPDLQVTVESLAASHVHLAEDDAGLLGFYSLITRPEPELDLMFVEDSVQGHGVGSQLFLHMVEVARGIEIPTVRIVAHPPAAGFYESMGALKIGMEPPRPPTVRWPRPVFTYDLTHIANT